MDGVFLAIIALVFVLSFVRSARRLGQATPPARGDAPPQPRPQQAALPEPPRPATGADAAAAMIPDELWALLAAGGRQVRRPPTPAAPPAAAQAPASVSAPAPVSASEAPLPARAGAGTRPTLVAALPTASPTATIGAAPDAAATPQARPAAPDRTAGLRRALVLREVLGPPRGLD